MCQSWEAKDRNLPHVLKMLDQAAAERAEIVCLPEECVPTDGGQAAQAALEAIAKVAAARSMIVAANLKEKEGDKLYSTSYLIGSDGKLIGKYRKSHRLPYEPIALGDELPVFDTPLGQGRPDDRHGLLLAGDPAGLGAARGRADPLVARAGAGAARLSAGHYHAGPGVRQPRHAGRGQLRRRAALPVQQLADATPASRWAAAAWWIARASSWPTRA